MGAFYFDQRPPIANLIISIEGENAILHWDAVPGALVYHIYRSNEPYFDIAGMNPIASVTEPSFTDFEIITNNRYFYRVTWE
jgi:fibronectin type 3 domain-containing protein